MKKSEKVNRKVTEKRWVDEKCGDRGAWLEGFVNTFRDIADDGIVTRGICFMPGRLKGVAAVRGGPTEWQLSKQESYRLLSRSAVCTHYRQEFRRRVKPGAKPKCQGTKKYFFIWVESPTQGGAGGIDLGPSLVARRVFQVDHPLHPPFQTLTF